MNFIQRFFDKAVEVNSVKQTIQLPVTAKKPYYSPLIKPESIQDIGVIVQDGKTNAQRD